MEDAALVLAKGGVDGASSLALSEIRSSTSPAYLQDVFRHARESYDGDGTAFTKEPSPAPE